MHSLQDLAAAAATLILIIGLIVLSLLRIEIPDAMNTAIGSATTWLFIRSTQAAENTAHRYIEPLDK